MIWLLTLATSLTLTLLILRRYHNSRAIKHTVSISIAAFVVLSAMYLAADYFTANGIDNSVIYHLGYGLSGAGFAEYSGLIGLSIAFLFAAWLLGHWSFQQLSSTGGKPGPGRWGSLLAGVFPLACMMHPTALDLAAVYNLTPHDLLRSTFTKTAGNGPTGSTFFDFYETPKATPPQSNRNLVFLYLESLERTYFDEARFPGLINELRELEKEGLSFTNIRGAEGTGFTIGGMVASQCGIPLVTSSHPNSMAGMDRFLPGAQCIGDLLADAGYQLDYMGGASLKFAGKGKFYTSHGFTQVRGKDELRAGLDDPDYLSNWGLYDDTVLEMVLQRYQELVAADRPFALFALTLDTHHPNGHPSRSCDGLVYEDGANPILNAVHCSDRLAARFIRKLRESAASDNTLLVVASDHIALRNSAYDQLTSGKRTNLLMIFDPASAQTSQNSRAGTTLDIAPTILSRLGFNVAAHGLGRDLLGGQANLAEGTVGVNTQLKSWREELAGFWDTPSAADGLIIDPQRETVVIAGREFSLPTIIEFDHSGEISALKFEHDSPQQLITYMAIAPPGNMLAWIDVCSKVRSLDTEFEMGKQGYCLFLGKIGSDAVMLRELASQVKITAADIEKYAAAEILPQVAGQRSTKLVTTIQNGESGVTYVTHAMPQLEQGMELTLRSSGGPKSKSGLVTADTVTPLSRGLHLLGLLPDGGIEKITQFDSCAMAIPPEASSLHETMAAPQKDYAAYLLLVHDSAVCGERTLEHIFSNLPLNRWQDIAVRTPYLAVLTTDGSAPKEFLGVKNTSLQLNLRSSL